MNHRRLNLRIFPIIHHGGNREGVNHGGREAGSEPCGSLRRRRRRNRERIPPSRRRKPRGMLEVELTWKWCWNTHHIMRQRRWRRLSFVFFPHFFLMTFHVACWGLRGRWVLPVLLETTHCCVSRIVENIFWDIKGSMDGGGELVRAEANLSAEANFD